MLKLPNNGGEGENFSTSLQIKISHTPMKSKQERKLRFLQASVKKSFSKKKISLTQRLYIHREANLFLDPIGYFQRSCTIYDILQNRRILDERALNFPSSVYKPPSWIRKTSEAWGECKRTAKGEGVNPAPFLALFHSPQLSTFCESKMVAKHSKEINNHKPTNRRLYI